MSHMCPICGYPDLARGPTIGNDDSYEICPCCGFEFGVTDMDKGYSYPQWREKWIQDGMIWWSKSDEIPLDWDPRLQLQNVGAMI